MTNRLLISLAALTSLAAVVTALHSLFADDGAVLWTALKVSACAVVPAANLIVVRHILRAQPVPFLRRAALLAGTALVAIGSAGMAWTLHLALVTGDMEGVFVLINALLALEGAFIIWQAGGVTTRAST